MILEAIIGILGGIIILAGAGMILQIMRWKKLEEKISKPLISFSPPQPVVINLQPLEQAIANIPNKVLHSIQSSTNTKKGALGELIGYIELEAQYDRIIPLGNIVDFICIKLPDISKQGMSPNGIMEEGCIDFVEIKTGKSSRLSKDQRLLQQLIKDKKINFVKLTVNTQTSETKSQTD